MDDSDDDEIIKLKKNLNKSGLNLNMDNNNKKKIILDKKDKKEK